MSRESEAFVFLNHYLDIVEAIEEGSLDSLDYSDFINTDFPQEIPLPASPYLEPAEHELVKEWVLAVSMDQSVDQVCVDLGICRLAMEPLPLEKVKHEFKVLISDIRSWKVLLVLRMYTCTQHIYDYEVKPYRCKTCL